MDFNLCRICFENTGITDIFDSTPLIPISTKIMYCCTSICIQKEDGFPVRVCDTCEMELSFAYKFVIKCEATDKKLHSLSHSIVKIHEGIVKSKMNTEENTKDKSLNYEPPENITLKTHQDEVPKLVVPVTCSNVKNIETTTVKSKHKVSAQQKCKSCGKQCSNQSTLIIHMRTHSEERPYACKTCDKKYKDSGGLKRHIERNHNLNRKREIICELCGKAFYSKYEVKTHMRTHTGETPYACSLCPSKFTQAGALLRHQLRHSGKKAYHCPKCKKKFLTKVALTRHLIVHSSEKKFICIICNSPLKYENNLKKHILQHSLGNNFICDYCGRMFRAKGSLKLHINSLHSSKSGTCHICSKDVSNIEVHMWRHTGKRPLKCDLCSSSFFEKKSLTRHINFRHKYNDKYKCIVNGCTDSFPSPPMLKYHVAKFHGSSIPFPCDTCSKGYYRKNDLTKHKLSNHRGEITV